MYVDFCTPKVPILCSDRNKNKILIIFQERFGGVLCIGYYAGRYVTRNMGLNSTNFAYYMCMPIYDSAILLLLLLYVRPIPNSNPVLNRRSFDLGKSGSTLV